eukprot:Gb_13117 [translate_table: standard]
MDKSGLSSPTAGGVCPLVNQFCFIREANALSNENEISYIQGYCDEVLLMNEDYTINMHEQLPGDIQNMGRAPCCDENGLKKGPWTPEEDQKLIEYIQKNGHGSWRALPKHAGLLRCGKSCRLRWTNYLRPDIKRGKFSFEEEQTILQLHAILGNKWSAIAAHLPGRTDNEIKNFWNTHLKKRLLQMGIDPMTHRPRTDLFATAHMFGSSLNNLASWENAARLEAEARLARHYLKLAAYRSNIISAEAMMNENGSFNADLNLLRSAYRSQFDDANPITVPQIWTQQQHPAGSMVFNPQVLDQELLQAAQASRCSENYGIPNQRSTNDGLSLQDQGSVTHFLDNMCSLALGTYSAPLQMENTCISNPASTLSDGLQLSNFKFQRSDNSIPPSDSCITGESLNHHKENQHVFSNENNLELNTRVSAYQEEYCNLLPSTMRGSMVTKEESSNALWPDKSNSLPPLVSSGSPRNIFTGPDLTDPEINSNSSTVNSNGYGPGVLPPELLLELTENSNIAKQNITVGSNTGTPLWAELNSEDGKDYWSNMLKLVDTVPGFE